MALIFSFPDVVDETSAHFFGVPHGHEHPAGAPIAGECSTGAVPNEQRALEEETRFCAVATDSKGAFTQRVLALNNSPDGAR